MPAVDGRATRLETERRFAIEAVVAASRLTRAVRRDFDPSQAAAKADASPVTVADLGAQALVSLALAETLPGDRLMGEEDSGPLAALARAGARPSWRGCASSDRRSRPTDVLDALDRCSDAGWTRAALVDAGPGRRHEGLPAQRAVRRGARARRGRRGRAGRHGLPQPAAGGCRRTPGLRRGWRRGGRMPLRRRAGPGRRHGAAREAATGVPGTPDPRRSASLARRTAATRSRSRRHTPTSRQPFASRRPWASRRSRSDWTARRSTPSWLAATPRSTCACRMATTARTSGTTPRARSSSARQVVASRTCEGRPLDFTTGRRMTANRGIVATAASIHDEVLAAVRSVLEA